MEKAWTVLQRIHHDPTDGQDLAAHAEFIQIEKQVAYDKEVKSGYIEMFTNPTWRKRYVISVFLPSPASIQRLQDNHANHETLPERY